ncbi:MAG: cation diffusion facilitator family transporter [Patescibacteria group bacterium]|nr:cation diffusion facilitator family transporter [Patescibacteria group bacterium]
MLSKQSVSIISTAVNGVMGIAKAVTGLAAGSSALVAEGLHSSIDFVSSGITYLGIRVAEKKPTKRHPYGWGQAEVLASLIVVIFIGLAGVEIVREAVNSLLAGEYEPISGLLSLVVMAASVVVNEVMARLKIRVGQEQESLALIADGKHSRVDVFSSGAAFLGIGLARYFPIADSLTALGVGIYILYETFELGKEVGENLLDVADLEAEKEIRKICAEEQVEVVDLKTRKIGSRTSAELEIKIPENVKMGRVDDLIHDLQRTLIDKVSRLEYVTIQIKGEGRRIRMFRGKCDEPLDKIGPDKQGRRVLTPYREGEIYEDFGAPEYLVTDYKNGKEIQRVVVENPYFKIGRGHGVQFARAVGADEVRTKEIGDNALDALKKLGIIVRDLEF